MLMVMTDGWRRVESRKSPLECDVKVAYSYGARVVVSQWSVFGAQWWLWLTGPGSMLIGERGGFEAPL